MEPYFESTNQMAGAGLNIYIEANSLQISITPNSKALIFLHRFKPMLDSSYYGSY